jgi:hypothetical protein
MGQLKGDGKATTGATFTAPGGQIINFGDLYRLNGWNHIAMTKIAVADTVRSYGGEFSAERIWYVLLPVALNPAVGDFLYWTAGAGFKRGDTDLTATVTGSPVAKVEEAKNANNYAAVRVLNIGP